VGTAQALAKTRQFTAMPRKGGASGRCVQVISRRMSSVTCRARTSAREARALARRSVCGGRKGPGRDAQHLGMGDGPFPNERMVCHRPFATDPHTSAEAISESRDVTWYY
jgi:hypothetical protein